MVVAISLPNIKSPENEILEIKQKITKGKVLEKLPGNYAIGHNRYSTAENNLIKNVIM